VLSSHEQVSEVVVQLREERVLEKRLVAYVVLKPGGSAAVSELRGYLEARLPQYMVPATFVWLEALPLLPNGKLDRRALPAPGAARPELEEHYQPPRTPEEEILAGIWSQVLGLEQVGIHDNFFALGGDSIVSIRVIARANEAGLHLTPKNVFESRPLGEGRSQLGEHAVAG